MISCCLLALWRQRRAEHVCGIGVGRRRGVAARPRALRTGRVEAAAVRLNEERLETRSSRRQPLVVANEEAAANRCGHHVEWPTPILLVPKASPPLFLFSNPLFRRP